MTCEPWGDSPERLLTLAPGNNWDVCPLCGIHRQNAGFLRETCGDGYLRDGCFVIATETTSSQEQAP